MRRFASYCHTCCHNCPLSKNSRTHAKFSQRWENILHEHNCVILTLVCKSLTMHRETQTLLHHGAFPQLGNWFPSGEPNIPSTERKVLRNKWLFVCVFVTGSKEHYRQGYWVWGATMVPEVIRSGELEYEVGFPRTRMVARQPIHPDFTKTGFPKGFWDTGSLNMWSIWLEYEGWPITNWNRVRRKQVWLRLLDRENMNLGSAHREGHGRWSCMYQFVKQGLERLAGNLKGVVISSDFLHFLYNL